MLLHSSSSLQIPTKATVTGHLPSAGSWPPTGNTGLAAALTGAAVVVIPAGVPRKPGMTRDDLFNTNAGIVQGLVEQCAIHCPEAVLAIISNPVNSTVPIAAEILKRAGVYDPRKLCGVTTLDVLRANTFVASHSHIDPAAVQVPVIGGHAGITILPLFSQVPGLVLSDADRAALTHRTQFGGDEVVQAKAGTGSATLSMAYAGYRFTEQVVRALQGETGVQQCAFVASTVVPELPYFATPCVFGKDGVEEVRGYGTISAYEQQWLEQMIPELQSQIQKGVDFVQKKK
jgi:malate dehydrogenase